jgi:hypothetical protein
MSTHLHACVGVHVNIALKPKVCVFVLVCILSYL